MATVLIMGASRGIGLEAARAALARGHRVRAFARRAGRIALEDPKLEKHAGDALNPGDVAGALDGVDAVIQALGVPADRRMVLGPVDLFSKATAVLVPAMEAAGVPRLIAVTGFGAGNSRASIGCLQNVAFQAVFGRAYADKDAQERLIEDSALDWTIVRPGVLTNGRRTGRYRVLVEPEQWRNGIIARADVADFLSGQIDDDTYRHRAPVLIRCPL